MMVLAAALGQLPSASPETALGKTPSVQDLTSSADHGRRRFTHVWSREDGLGPQFNARSCHSCHVSPMPGGAGTDRISMVHLSPRALDPTGGHVMRKFLMGPEGRIGSRTPPADAVLRKPPSLFGIGDLEQVPENVLVEYADSDDRDGDGVSGRLAQVTSGVGRFGWKARFATIEDAVAAAFVNELGLTTSRYPDDGSRTDRKKPEVDDATWHAVAGFVRSLRPLLSDEPTDAAGSEIFHRVGCAACHRPTLAIPGEVGGSAREIHPYTDLLLHEMGPALADGIREGDASGQEFRTPPLWGIARTGPPYLHDGRAQTIHEAIVAHDGEAARSGAAYRALPESGRQALWRFVASR